MKSLLKSALLTAIALVVATVARRYLAGRDLLVGVAPDLRSPLLPILTFAPTARSLPLVRLLLRISTSVDSRATLTKAVVAAAPPVAIEVITPNRNTLHTRPGLLWLHTGGMISGSPRSERALASKISTDLDAVIVSPDYRLAPEHPFPAGLDDCMATLHWMHAESEGLGVDPSRIAVVGASAGGGLAAAVAQRAHAKVLASVLNCPMLDDRTTLRDSGGRDRFVWTPKANDFGWTAYLGRKPRMSDAPVYAAPARREDLTGLAPAWVGVGELDLFYDEAVTYAQRLRSAGNDCEMITVPGMYHGAEALAPKAPAVEQLRHSMITHLREHLTTSPI